MVKQLKEEAVRRPFNTLMMAVLTALVLWSGKTIFGSSLLLERIDERVVNMQVNMQTIVDDSYTRAEALGDRALLDTRINQVQRRAEDLDERVKLLERAL